MKVYKGRRLEPEKGTVSNVVVTVEEVSEMSSLKHHVCHSPTGFNWGYGGSGPADLALSILWDYFGAEPHASCYQDFKSEFVAGWKDEWEITQTEIREWLLKRKKTMEYERREYK